MKRIREAKELEAKNKQKKFKAPKEYLQYLKFVEEKTQLEVLWKQR